MMVDVQTPIFINPDFAKLRMSNSNTSWFDNDISSFLNVAEDVMEFPQSVPTSSPIADHHYYATSSPEQFNSPDASPYSSDVSQSPSPFDATLFAESPQSSFTGSIDVDPSLFEPCNLTNPLLLPEIEKILAATPYSQPQAEFVQATHEPATSKKRHREDSKSEVTLSREQLLTMTSKEIEDYVSQLKTKRTLTASEEKDLKRQRRLVKNREYASQSRTRKKQYVDEIEKQLDQAKAETDVIRKQNQALMEENKLLKKQLGNIADAIKKSQSGAPNLSSSSGNVGMFAKFATIGGGRNNTSKTVSACLLAICFMVFTFATFWNVDEPLGARLFPKENFVFAGPRRLLWNQFESEPEIPADYYPQPPKLNLEVTSSLVSKVVVEPVLTCASLLAKSMCSPAMCTAENSTCSYPDQGLLVS